MNSIVLTLPGLKPYKKTSLVPWEYHKRVIKEKLLSNLTKNPNLKTTKSISTPPIIITSLMEERKVNKLPPQIWAELEAILIPSEYLVLMMASPQFLNFRGL